MQRARGHVVPMPYLAISLYCWSDTSTKQFLYLKLMDNWRREGRKDCKRQRKQKLAVRVSPKSVKEATFMTFHQHGFLNKSWTPIGMLKWKGKCLQASTLDRIKDNWELLRVGWMVFPSQLVIQYGMVNPDIIHIWISYRQHLHTHTHNSRIESSWIIAEGGWKFYIYMNLRAMRSNTREGLGRGKGGEII